MSTHDEEEALKQSIATLEAQLVEARAVIQQWGDAAASLSLSATDLRVRNQAAGRGFFGRLLGAKYRGAVRRSAAASNASIAQDVATKRSTISDGKRNARAVEASIKATLATAKVELKTLAAAGRKTTRSSKRSHDDVSLLKRLKEAHDLGLLTKDEYEEKRRTLVARI